MKAVRALLLAWIAWALALRADVWRREHVGHPKGHLVVDRPRWYPPRRLHGNAAFTGGEVRRGVLDMRHGTLAFSGPLTVKGVLRLGAAPAWQQGLAIDDAGDWEDE